MRNKKRSTRSTPASKPQIPDIGVEKIYNEASAFLQALRDQDRLSVETAPREVTLWNQRVKSGEPITFWPTSIGDEALLGRLYSSEANFRMNLGPILEQCELLIQRDPRRRKEINFSFMLDQWKRLLSMAVEERSAPRSKTHHTPRKRA